MEDKKPRSIKELLQFLKNEIRFIKTGLCGLALYLHSWGNITTEEYHILRKYIKDNRPFILSSWEGIVNFGSGYYWTPGKTHHRIKWLNKHIKKNS